MGPAFYWILWGIRVTVGPWFDNLPHGGGIGQAILRIKSVGRPMRSIRTEFSLPPATDPEYLFRVLGGRIDPGSPWTSVSMTDGRVIYRNINGP